MKFCTNCGKQLEEGVKFCYNCGAPTSPTASSASTASNQAAPGANQTGTSSTTVMDSLTSLINGLAGGKGAVRPPLKTVFSQVLDRHTKEESEEIFIGGTASTTPELNDDGKAWPHPWLWSRIFLVFLVSFVFLYICCTIFDNLNAYPGLIFMGSFAVPIAIMFFFFELNTPRNISFYSVLKYFLIGGCASLVSTLFLFELVSVADPWVEAVVIGIVEEVGKLVIVAIILFRVSQKYYVNGLLVGAAVGAGFAAFESAGYAFRIFLINILSSGNIETSYDEMVENILLRGFLAPGGHVIWAAMTGYALMLIKEKENKLDLGFIAKTDFWKLFIIPIVIHAVWDMPFDFGESMWGNVVFCSVLLLLGWVVVFVLISNSLSQIGKILVEKKRAEVAAQQAQRVETPR